MRSRYHGLRATPILSAVIAAMVPITSVNAIADTYKDGITVGASPGVRGQGSIVANSIRGTRINGIFVTGDLQGLVIRDNPVQRPGLDGLSLIGVHTCMISSNTVYTAGTHGIALRSSGECHISENVVSASGRSGVDLTGELP